MTSILHDIFSKLMIGVLNISANTQTIQRLLCYSDGSKEHLTTARRERITERGNTAKLYRHLLAAEHCTFMHVPLRRFIPHYFSCSTLIFRRCRPNISAGNTNSTHFKTNYQTLGKRLKCISYLHQLGRTQTRSN